MTKHEAKAELSLRLRNKAIRAGFTIDETYRNENGMDMKIANMQFLYTSGKKGLSSYSKLDEEIYKTYNTDHQKYEKLLEKGLKMSDLDSNIIHLDFNKQLDYAYTTPVKCIFLNEELPRTYTGWSPLYVQILKKIKEKYPDIVKPNSYYTESKKNIDVVDELKIYQLRRYAKIDTNLYVEVNLSAHNIICRLLYILNECGLQKDALHIDYIQNKKSEQKILSTTKVFNDKQTGIKQAFSYWLVNTGMAQKTAEIYSNAVTKAERIAHENNLESQSIYIESKSDIKRTIELLYKNENFLEINKGLHNQISAAILKYADFVGLKDIPEIETSVQRRTIYPVNETRKKFSEWLANTGMAQKTIDIYSGAIARAERFAKEHNFEFYSLYTEDIEMLKKTTELLLANPDFLELNKSLHNHLSSAINKLYDFSGLQNQFHLPYSNTNLSLSNVEKFYDSNFEIILKEKFSKGYKIDSIIDRKKFLNFYQSLTNQPINVPEDQLDRKIQSMGILVNDRVYVSSNLFPEDRKEGLLSQIKRKLDAGAKNLYFEALYQELIYEFENTNIYSADMLRAYLLSVNDNDFVINKNYLSNIDAVQLNPIDEVRELLINEGMALSYDSIFAKLAHISESRLRQLLAANSEFINNGRESFFHRDVVHITNEELVGIKNIISNAISKFNYISGDELVESVKKSYPSVLENNSTISDIGLRKYLSICFSNEFSFKGDIISSKESNYSMSDIFAEFCKSKDYFTIDELAHISQLIYFDPVYLNAVRINQKEFIAPQNIDFPVKEIDEAIERFLNGTYISLSVIEQFGSFPDVGYKWNEYLLESYVFNHSNQFKLIHNTFNANVCVGAIVRKTSGINDISSLFADVLANSDISLSSNNALNYLCDKGYLARRNFKSIDPIIIKAQEIRNQKRMK